MADLKKLWMMNQMTRRRWQRWLELVAGFVALGKLQVTGLAFCEKRCCDGELVIDAVLW
jgi:hypothetical protein